MILIQRFMPTQGCHGRIIFSAFGQKKEENIWRRKIFGTWWRRRRQRRKIFAMHRKKRTEKEKEGKWEKLLQSRRLEIEGSRRGPCGPKNLTFPIQGIQFETVTKTRIF